MIYRNIFTTLPLLLLLLGSCTATASMRCSALFENQAPPKKPALREWVERLRPSRLKASARGKLRQYQRNRLSREYRRYLDQVIDFERYIDQHVYNCQTGKIVTGSRPDPERVAEINREVEGVLRRADELLKKASQEKKALSDNFGRWDRKMADQARRAVMTHILEAISMVREAVIVSLLDEHFVSSPNHSTSPTYPYVAAIHSIFFQSGILNLTKAFEGIYLVHQIPVLTEYIAEQTSDGKMTREKGDSWMRRVREMEREYGSNPEKHRLPGCYDWNAGTTKFYVSRKEVLEEWDCDLVSE